MKKNKYALLSVFDKTGIVEFAKELDNLGYKIISTGGTAAILTQNKISVVPIQDITHSPESFDGRMKTISFQIGSGILFDRTNLKHVKEAKALKTPQIDLVVCNLYPFEQTISKPNVKFDDAIENIDVGGPTMIRAAAKNHKNVLVVVDPNDYEMVSDYLRSRHPEFILGRADSGSLQTRMRSRNSQSSDEMLKLVQHDNGEDFRKKLAVKAFSHTAFYDSLITNYLSDEQFPDIKTLPLRKSRELRYGENPHQKASIYMFPLIDSPFNRLNKLWGRDLSYVNATDINAGLESVRMFSEHAAVVIKHNCPCGIALGKTAAEALKRAIAADPESAFGGIIVMNKPMTLKAAKEIGKFKDETRANIDIVAVPEIEPKALKFLQKVRRTMGIYTFGEIKNQKSKIKDLHYKLIDGGMVVQTQDDISEHFKNWKVVTKKKPTKKQMEQAKIAWKFITRIKSNAILVLDKILPQTRGVGTGQTSRIRSTKIALEQAGEHAKEAILASDSFFPFDDSVKLAAQAGIECIVQQGGSINDQASIDAADKAGIVMIFTGVRAFWH